MREIVKAFAQAASRAKAVDHRGRWGAGAGECPELRRAGRADAPQMFEGEGIGYDTADESDNLETLVDQDVFQA